MQKSSKKISNWIYRSVTQTIHHDQVRFIPGTQVWLNIKRPINEIYDINKQKKKYHIIISIDTKKVFDKIQHRCMIKKKKRSQ